MKEHKLSGLLPEMSEKEFTDLVADIDANGQQDPIILFDGAILDGRHRWRACEKLGIKPKTEVFEGDYSSARNFVFSRNLYRRHLSESQRAMLAADTVTSTVGGGHSANLQNGKMTASDAAKAFKVSTRSVNTARKIKKKGTRALANAVKSGKLKVSKAAAIADLPKEKQGEAIKNPESIKPEPSRGKIKPRLLKKIDDWWKDRRYEAPSPSTAIGEAREIIDSFDF